MSELKAGVIRTPHNEGMSFDGSSVSVSVEEGETEFYLKPEVDKVIAEKNKEISELQKQVHDYAQGLYEIQAKAKKEIRTSPHHANILSITSLRLESSVATVGSLRSRNLMNLKTVFASSVTQGNASNFALSPIRRTSNVQVLRETEQDNSDTQIWSIRVRRCRTPVIALLRRRTQQNDSVR